MSLLFVLTIGKALRSYCEWHMTSGKVVYTEMTFLRNHDVATNVGTAIVNEGHSWLYVIYLLTLRTLPLELRRQMLPQRWGVPGSNPGSRTDLVGTERVEIKNAAVGQTIVKGEGFSLKYHSYLVVAMSDSIASSPIICPLTGMHKPRFPTDTGLADWSY